MGKIAQALPFGLCNVPSHILTNPLFFSSSHAQSYTLVWLHQLFADVVLNSYLLHSGLHLYNVELILIFYGILYYQMTKKSL